VSIIATNKDCIRRGKFRAHRIFICGIKYGPRGAYEISQSVKTSGAIECYVFLV
jgi:hypothetical protein